MLSKLGKFFINFMASSNRGIMIRRKKEKTYSLITYDKATEEKAAWDYFNSATGKQQTDAAINWLNELGV